MPCFYIICMVQMLNDVKSSSFCKNSLTTGLLQGKKVSLLKLFWPFWPFLIYRDSELFIGIDGRDHNMPKTGFKLTSLVWTTWLSVQKNMFQLLGYTFVCLKNLISLICLFMFMLDTVANIDNIAQYNPFKHIITILRQKSSKKYFFIPKNDSLAIFL